MLESVSEFFKGLRIFKIFKWRVLSLKLDSTDGCNIYLWVWTTLEKFGNLKHSLVGLYSLFAQELHLFLLFYPLPLFLLIVSAHHWVKRLEFKDLFIFILGHESFLENVELVYHWFVGNGYRMRRWLVGCSWWSLLNLESKENLKLMSCLREVFKPYTHFSLSS